jgi:hypothetical protein
MNSSPKKPEKTEATYSTISSSRDFFISYNAHDTVWAEWMAWHLEDAGYTTIVQCWDFLPGANFVLEMDTALKRAQQTLLVLSSHYLQARFPMPEWASIFSEDPTGEFKKLIPVRVEDVSLSGLLRSIIYIDLVGKSEAAAKEELIS